MLKTQIIIVMSDEKILQELIYGFDINKTLPIWYTSFPEFLFHNLHRISQKIRKKKEESLIPVASLNDTIRASSGVLSTGRNIAREENEILRQFWLMSHGQPINYESIKLVLLSWLTVEFRKRENFSDKDYDVLQEALDLIEPSQEISLTDLPFEKMSLSWKLTLADAIAVNIIKSSQEEPIPIGKEEYRFIKSANPGEIQQWPPKPHLKNGQVQGFSSLCFYFRVGYRYFDAEPKIYVHPVIRRYIAQPFEPKYDCAATLHIQAPADYWQPTLPFGRSLQVINLIKRSNRYSFRNKVLDVLNRLEEGNDLTPEAEKIIQVIPKHGIIPEKPATGKLTVLVLKTTALQKPTIMKNPGAGLFSHDKRLIFDFFKTRQGFSPADSLSECNVTVSRKKKHLTQIPPLTKFARENTPINILVSIPQHFNKLREKVSKKFEELKSKYQAQSTINIIFAPDNLANSFIRPWQRNDQEAIRTRKSQITKMFEAIETENNCSFDCALIAIQNPDYPEYKNGRNDPKLINTKILSELGMVCQFLVTSYDEIKYDKKTSEQKITYEKDNNMQCRVEKAICDLMRQLDIPCHKKFETVKLTNTSELTSPEELLIVSFYVLRITGKTASNKIAKLMPVITTINNNTGKISILLMNANNQNNEEHTQWLSVREAEIVLASDDLEYVELKTNRDKALQRVRTFFVDNLKTLCDSSKDILLVVQEDNIRQVIPNLSTEKCHLDALPFSPTGDKSVFDRLRIVIVKANDKEVSTAYKIWKDKRHPFLDRESYPAYGEGELYQVNDSIYISLGDRGMEQQGANISKLDYSFKEVKYYESWREVVDDKKIKDEYPGNISWKKVIDNLDQNSYEPYTMGKDYTNGCKYQTDKGYLIKAQKIKNRNTVYYEQILNEWSLRSHLGKPVELIVQKVPKNESRLREGWARVVHELRSDSIQYEHSLKVPLILDIPRKLVDYFRLSDSDIVRGDSDDTDEEETNEDEVEL